MVHDRIIDLAEQLLGITDPRMYQAMLSAKYSGGAPKATNSSSTSTSPTTRWSCRVHEPGYQQLEMFVYLSDVTPETAATRIVSRHLTSGIPVERTYLEPGRLRRSLRGRGPGLGPGRVDPGLPPRRVPPGRAHDRPGAARFMLHVSYKPGSTDWLGSFGLPNAGEDLSWYRFVRRATVRQLTVLGFPAPGHPYWTAQTLAGVAARYPMLDLSPWRDAIAGAAE